MCYLFDAFLCTTKEKWYLHFNWAFIVDFIANIINYIMEHLTLFFRILVLFFLDLLNFIDGYLIISCPTMIKPRRKRVNTEGVIDTHTKQLTS